ncbi:TetR family transcriptional regulator [Longispora fulva]|uniref:AcrR family transcriptional regulator n=1 Tax=Longispora fulva TaxID=619741 RepID=A0A8J7KJH0_9ACTN|nr:TetR family transcriptional regulator [Longispora fulva]MBG6135456.1 AcrR family transcriptional regulator [Longispora fulva]
MRNLADRKRQLVRDEIAEAALKLLAHHGFDDTTIEHIAAAAGVSKRTFFRYFPAKEDVILDVVGELGELARDTLATSPTDEPPATSLRRALGRYVDAIADGEHKALLLTRLILGTPALRARYLDRQLAAQDDIASVLTTRGMPQPRAAVVAAVAFAAYQTAVRRWADLDGTPPLTDLVDQAFALVKDSLA